MATMYSANLKNISDHILFVTYDGKLTSNTKINPGETVTVQFSSQYIPVTSLGRLGNGGFDVIYTDEGRLDFAAGVVGKTSSPNTYYLDKMPPTPTAYIGTTPVITLK